jgi:hypothetical protein
MVKRQKVVWAQNKNGPNSFKITPPSNRKAKRTTRSLKPQPSPIEQSKARMMLFWFKLQKANNLVPHRSFKKDRVYIKKTQIIPNGTFAHHGNTTPCGNTPMFARVSPHAVIWHHRSKVFCSSKHNPREASTPTRGVRLLG